MGGGGGGGSRAAMGISTGTIFSAASCVTTDCGPGASTNSPAAEGSIFVGFASGGAAAIVALSLARMSWAASVAATAVATVGKIQRAMNFAPRRSGFGAAGCGGCAGGDLNPAGDADPLRANSAPFNTAGPDSVTVTFGPETGRRCATSHWPVDVSRADATSPVFRPDRTRA